MNFKNLAALPENQNSAAQTLRVLVVDDDEFIRQINYEVLLSAGYDVDKAEDGSKAWDALQHQDYDLLVTDNQMPNVSGLELIRKIRDARMELPVLMATSTLPDAALNQNHSHRPVTTLLKPYTIEEFLIAVEVVLAGSQPHHDALTCPNQQPSPDFRAQPVRMN
jgi:CheY-like chemotaxis protein